MGPEWREVNRRLNPGQAAIREIQIPYMGEFLDAELS